MNSKLSAVLVMAGFISLAANAVEVAGWERPIKEAAMEEIDADGKTVGVGLDRVLTLNRRDGAKKATTFTFREQVQVQCVKAPCPPINRTIFFRILKSKADSCNSIHYNATEILPPNSKKLPTQLNLVDHDTRICDDYKPFNWEAKVGLPTGMKMARTLRGNAKWVYRIQ